MTENNLLPTPNGHFIDLATASEMTLSYRNEHENILGVPYKNQQILPLSETFHRNAIDSLLSQEGCEGVRIYYGMDESTKVHAIMVGVNSDNEDILSGANARSESDPVIIELAHRCPDMCPPESPLNS